MCTFNEILNSVQIVSLIPITGGTLVLGALIAPLTFQVLNKKDAGKFMMMMFQKFDTWIKFSSIALLASKILQFAFINKFSFFYQVAVEDKLVSKLDFSVLISVLLALAIAAISLHIVFRLSSRMIEIFDDNAKTQTDEFQSLHKQSEMLHKVNFMLGFLLLIMFA